MPLSKFSDDVITTTPLMEPRTCMKTSYVLEMQHFLGYQIKWTERNWDLRSTRITMV